MGEREEGRKGERKEGRVGGRKKRRERRRNETSKGVHNLLDNV